jgi:hypothetical protein
MAGTLKRAAKYVESSREDLLELLKKLLAGQEMYSDKISYLTIEVSLQRVEGYNAGYRMGYWDCWRKFDR